MNNQRIGRKSNRRAVGSLDFAFADIMRQINEAKAQASSHNQMVARMPETSVKKRRTSSETSNLANGNDGDMLSNMLKTMNEMRENGEQCDATIICDGRHFQAHKVVLASRSGYFRSMFNSSMVEANQKEISLSDISVDTMDQLLHFIYTTEHKLTTENAQNLLIAANFLQINDLPDICGKFIFQTLDLANCASMRQLLFSTNCDRKMVDDVTIFIKIHFQQIIQKESLIELDVNALVDLFSIEGVVCDSEEYVCISAIKWLEAKPERKAHALRVLQTIRMPLLTSYFVNTYIRENPIFNNVMSCLDHISHQLSSESVISRACKMSILAYTNHPSARFYYKEICWKRWEFLDETGGKQLLFHCQYLFLVMSLRDSLNTNSFLKRFDFCKKEWKTIPGKPDFSYLSEESGPAMVQSQTAVIVDNQLYVFVEIGDHSRCIKIFNIATSRWSEGPKMFQSSGPLAITFLDKFIYVFEIKNKNGPLKAKKLDTTTLMWTDVAPIVKNRDECGVTVYNRKIYIAGGSHDHSSTFFEGYNPETDEWFELAPITPGNGNTTLVAVLEGIYAFERSSPSTLTSESTNSKAFASTNRMNFYDVEKNVWMQQNPFPYDFGLFCAVPHFLL